MSIRHLDALFAPRSVAVIGASVRPRSVGSVLWHNVRSSGFAGTVYPVNPKYHDLTGHRCYARVADLPEVPDLALVCTPVATVAGLVKQLARCGTRGVVVVSTGLSALQKQTMLDSARPNHVRILGPSSIGLLTPHAGLNASFAPCTAHPGELAFVSQSGALATAVLDWAWPRQIGFSQVVSLGEHVDVDFADMLDHLARDPHTRAILLHMESIRGARTFMSAARAAARSKPVIVLKAGRSTPGPPMSADDVADAAIARAGMLRVDSLEALLQAAEILSRFKAPTGEAITVLTNGSGAGLLAADAAASLGMPLAELGAPLLADLDKVLPPNWSRGNPVNILGDAPAQRYADALDVLARHRQQVGTVLLIHTPSAIVPATDIAEALVPAIARHSAQPLSLVSAWVGGPALAEARQRFAHAGIACFDTPEQAVAAIGLLQRHARQQAALTTAPPATLPAEPAAPDVARVRQLAQHVLASGRDTLTATEAKAVCEAYGIAVTAFGQEPPDATAAPQALRVTARIDPVFGPVIRFGQGGAAADVLNDSATALPPLNAPLARALIYRTRVARLLHGDGNMPPADVDAVVATLLAVSQLLADVPEVAELDMDPLLVNHQGAMALHARVRVSHQHPAGAAQFAIQPYPAELVETLDWRGQHLTLRPIRPEDEARHLAFLESLDPEDVRMRLFHSRRTLERSELARLVQIDYAREMAFVATVPGQGGQEQTLGVARALADPDNTSAEFGVIVRPELKGTGLGRILLDRLVRYQRAKGTQHLTAVVLTDNQRMRHLAQALGFTDRPTPGQANTHELTLALQPQTSRRRTKPR